MGHVISFMYHTAVFWDNIFNNADLRHRLAVPIAGRNAAKTRAEKCVIRLAQNLSSAHWGRYLMLLQLHPLWCAGFQFQATTHPAGKALGYILSPRIDIGR